MGVLILTREQIKQVIDMREVLEKVREVYQLKSKGESVIWPLVNYEFKKENAAMDIRSGYVMGEEQLHGMKMLNNFPGNIEKGLQPFNGIMLVYDSNTGIPIGIMDASYITCMRTGAAGAIGVDALVFIVNENLQPGSTVQNLLMKVLLVLVAVSVLYSVLVCFVPETGWYSDVYPWAYQDVIETAQFWT